jgi:hypothetical protein
MRLLAAGSRKLPVQNTISDNFSSYTNICNSSEGNKRTKCAPARLDQIFLFKLTQSCMIENTVEPRPKIHNRNLPQIRANCKLGSLALRHLGHSFVPALNHLRKKQNIKLERAIADLRLPVYYFGFFSFRIPNQICV